MAKTTSYVVTIQCQIESKRVRSCGCWHLNEVVGTTFPMLVPEMIKQQLWTYVSSKQIKFCHYQAVVVVLVC